MDNIQYDPERILNGLPEDVLKELAKKLKRRIRQNKNDIIQEILSPPKGKAESRARIWQEINRQLRKELETFSEEMSGRLSADNVPKEEQFKVGYMLTLSANPEIRALGEELYCLAEQNYNPNTAEDPDFKADGNPKTDTGEEKETPELIEIDKVEKVIEIVGVDEPQETQGVEEKTEIGKTELIKEPQEDEDRNNGEELGETQEAREAEAEAAIVATDAEESSEVKDSEVLNEAGDSEETVIDNEETNDISGADELLETEVAGAVMEVRNSEETTEAREAEKMIKPREAQETIGASISPTVHFKEPVTEEAEELQRKIKTLENKLRKSTAEGLRTKGQLEKLKTEMAALKAQWVREKEETGKYRNRVKELEEERLEKDKEIEALKQKLDLKKTIIPSKTKEQSQRRELSKVKSESGSEIDLALYQGRKALIFAERDNDLDMRLNALGIIPIWAMEIDWNRPRRRMSTCEVVLYKMNDKKLKKIDEIRDTARYWNIPCNELLNI